MIMIAKTQVHNHPRFARDAMQMNACELRNNRNELFGESLVCPKSYVQRLGKSW